MKKLFYFLCLLVMGLNFTSCDDDDDVVPTVEATLTFNAPEDIIQYNPDVTIETLVLKNVNTGAVIEPLKTARAAASASVKVIVPEGLYDVDMEAKVSYKVNNTPMNSHLRAYKEAVSLVQATAATPLTFPTYIYNSSSENGGFVLAEVYFTGSATPEGKQYDGDKYFRIYNNSNDTLCADGLTIAESAFLTVDKQAYTPDIMNEAFSTNNIYRIPLGSKKMVAPGESILIVDNAIDHTEANTNSFDLSEADFEWFDEHDNPNFQDVDNKNVPNLERVYTSSLTLWIPHNRGFSSFVLCRLGEDFDHQLSAEEYLKNNHYEYSYDFVYPGGVIPMKRDAYKIPNEWILDAVNMSIESKFQWIVTSPALDKGWTYCGKVDHDQTRYNKSVRRKVISGKLLQDTNDSSVDFLPEQKADPFFKFY